MTGEISSWLTYEGNKDVLGMKGANASGKEGVGGKRCRESIPEQLLTATYALTLFVFASVLKRKISCPRKGNATLTLVVYAGAGTIEYHG